MSRRAGYALEPAKFRRVERRYLTYWILVTLSLRRVFLLRMDRRAGYVFEPAKQRRIDEVLRSSKNATRPTGFLSP